MYTVRNEDRKTECETAKTKFDTLTGEKQKMTFVPKIDCDEDCQSEVEAVRTQKRCEFDGDLEWYNDETIDIDSCSNNKIYQDCQNVTDYVMRAQETLEKTEKRCRNMRYLKVYKMSLDEDESSLPDEEMENATGMDSQDTCNLDEISTKSTCADGKFCMSGFCNADNTCKPTQDSSSENDARSSYMIEPTWCKDEKICDRDLNKLTELQQVLATQAQTCDTKEGQELLTCNAKEFYTFVAPLILSNLITQHEAMQCDLVVGKSDQERALQVLQNATETALPSQNKSLPSIIRPIKNATTYEENVYGKDEKLAGNYGGVCKCPNGRSYFVGDNNDNCATLACSNGME